MTCYVHIKQVELKRSITFTVLEDLCSITVLDYTVLRRPVLDYTILRRTVLDYTVLRRPVLDYTVLRRHVLDYTILRKTVLDYNVLRRTTRLHSRTINIIGQITQHLESK